jgi:hypothetical protein
MRKLLNNRDEIITMLARADSASVPRLNSLYMDFVRATRSSLVPL